MARIHYEWNDLDSAWSYGEQGLVLARQYDSSIDMFVVCEVLLARFEVARGDLESAEKRLAEAGRTAVENDFHHRLPEIHAAQAMLQLRMGRLPEATDLPPPPRIRILLAKGMPEEASALMDAWEAGVENLADECLRAMVLRAVVREACGNHDAALETMESALSPAFKGGFIRLFVDEGEAVCHLVRELHGRGKLPEYTSRILEAFRSAGVLQAVDIGSENSRDGRELLSAREREVLLDIATGLSNQDIAEKLFISQHTVKVHVRNIFAKLEISSRTSAVARARSLGIIP
jgi:LuxR family maltose regulon positive regulatory protein